MPVERRQLRRLLAAGATLKPALSYLLPCRNYAIAAWRALNMLEARNGVLARCKLALGNNNNVPVLRCFNIAALRVVLLGLIHTIKL